MIPYVEIPTLEVPIGWSGLGPLRLSIFGLLVASGIMLGSRLSQRFARARGIPSPELQRLTTAVVVVGLAFAHWVSVLGYYPQRVAAHPWLLIRFFDGISSVGGFLGGAVAFAWLTRRAPNRWVLADALVFGLVAGFTLGRLGCALVHDHPGMVVAATHPLGVGPWPDGRTRLDLGLLELMGLVGLASLTYTRSWRRPGALTVTVVVLYATGRFALDFLRADDLRHIGLTTAQWLVLVFVAACAGLWLRRDKRGGP